MRQGPSPTLLSFFGRPGSTSKIPCFKSYLSRTMFLSQHRSGPVARRRGRRLGAVPPAFPTGLKAPPLLFDDGHKTHHEDRRQAPTPTQRSRGHSGSVHHTSLVSSAGDPLRRTSTGDTYGARGVPSDTGDTLNVIESLTPTLRLLEKWDFNSRLGLNTVSMVFVYWRKTDRSDSECLTRLSTPESDVVRRGAELSRLQGPGTDVHVLSLFRHWLVKRPGELVPCGPLHGLLAGAVWLRAKYVSKGASRHVPRHSGPVRRRRAGHQSLGGPGTHPDSSRGRSLP